MAALNVALTGNLRTIYLYNSNGAPTVGGAATGITTTPWMFYNDGWTTHAADALVQYAGGPPFRAGRTPLYEGWDNVQETFTLELYCANHDSVAAHLQELYQVLNSARTFVPCIMAITPPGSSKTMYTEVYSAKVQPLPQFNNLLNPVAGSTTIGVQVTITRAPFYTDLAGASSWNTFDYTVPGDRILNSTTFTVGGGTGVTPTNFFGLGVPLGDLVLEGSPLLIQVYNTAAAGQYNEVWCATAVAQLTSAMNTALNTTIGTPGASVSIASMSDPNQYPNTKMRVTARVTGAAGTTYRFRATGYSGTTILYDSGWVTPTSTAGAIYAMVDFGEFDLDALRRLGIYLGGSVNYEWYASAGGSTLIYYDAVQYYDFVKVQGNVPNSRVLWLAGYATTQSRPTLPITPVAVAADSVKHLSYSYPVIGTMPRYYSTCSLWLQWVDVNGQQPTAAALTSRVVVNAAPQYLTLRGNN